MLLAVSSLSVKKIEDASDTVQGEIPCIVSQGQVLYDDNHSLGKGGNDTADMLLARITLDLLN